MVKYYGICAEDFYFTKFNGKKYVKYKVGQSVPLSRRDFEHFKSTGRFEVEKTDHAYFAYNKDLASYSICKLSKIFKVDFSLSVKNEEVYENK